MSSSARISCSRRPGNWPKSSRRRLMSVGRKRTKNLHLPAGVREREGVWYWQPTSKRERDELKKRRAGTGEPISCTLGLAKSRAALEKWAELSGYRDIIEAEGTVAELLMLWKRDG